MMTGRNKIGLNPTTMNNILGDWLNRQFPGEKLKVIGVSKDNYEFIITFETVETVEAVDGDTTPADKVVTR